jgi:putative ABC transport system permease protein
MQALRYAIRQLARSPGFTIVAVLIVALGIGAATAMFSTVNALVLRPVALPESDRLVVVYETNLPRNIQRFTASYPDYRDWRDRSRSWESMGAITWRSMNLTGGGEPEFVSVRAMTANLLPTLGLAPALGRGFLEEEDRPGHNHVAIVSHAFWQRRFQGRPDVIGQSLTLDGTLYPVVGVMPAGAFFPDGLEIAIPIGAQPATDRRYDHEFEVYGRLRRGVTLQQADAELKSIAGQLYAGYSDTDRSWSTEMVPLSHEIVGSALRTGLFVLFGAVGLLLLIACANLSNLLLVRASARAHELAIRTALGAGRRQLVRQLVTESFALTGTGGLVGVLMSLWGVELLRATPLPRAAEITVDGRVLAAACGFTLLVGCFAGLGTALKASRVQPHEALKNRAPRSGHRSRLRDTMVVAQLALSLSLLVGAALLVQSFLHLVQVNPGFATERVLTVSLRPEKDADAISFYERVIARVAALPEVTGAGLISGLPFADGDSSNPVLPVGPTVLSPGEAVQSSWRLVDGGYFDVVGIPLVSGRTYAGLPPDQARQSIVLSASLARRLFGDTDPIGRQVDQINPGEHRLTVIGVVGDVRNRHLNAAPAPSFYFSMHLFRFGPMRMVVRTTGAIGPLAAAIRRIVKEVDPTVPAFRFRTMSEFRADDMSRERFFAFLLGGFAGAALLLAALGTYGVIAFTVQQRTQEIGIRIAVGAQTRDILGLVLGQGLRLVALGTVLGLAGAFASARLLSAMLYETGTTDPWSYLFATAVLALAALGATLLPACRATRVDPIFALRSE